MLDLFSNKFDPKTEIPDLSGRVAVVTGSTSGPGFHIAEYLAINGAKVYLCGRTEEKTQAALERFRALHPPYRGRGEVVRLTVDMMDPRKVEAAAKAILKIEDRLDYLVNNTTGAPLMPYSLTPDGLETLVAINYISPFVFTATLLPLLRRTAAFHSSDVRIITVTSSVYTLSPVPDLSTKESAFQQSHCTPHAGNINTFSTCMSRYAYTKRLSFLFSHELQRRILNSTPAGSNPIICMSVNGGKPDTGPIDRLLSANALESAAASLFACTARVVRDHEKRYVGAYVGEGGRLERLLGDTGDEQMASRLWEVSEEVVTGIWKGVD